METKNKTNISRQRSRSRKGHTLEVLTNEIRSLAKDKIKAYRRMQSVFKVRRLKVQQLRRLILRMQQTQRQRAKKRRKYRRQRAQQLFHLMIQQMEAALTAKKNDLRTEKKKNERKLQKELTKLKKLAQKTPKTWRHFKGHIKRLELSFAGILPLENVLQKKPKKKREYLTDDSAMLDINVIGDKDCQFLVDHMTKSKTNAPDIVQFDGPYKLPPPRTVTPSGIKSSMGAFKKMRRHLRSQRKPSPYRIGSALVGISDRITIHGDSSHEQIPLLSLKTSLSYSPSRSPNPRSRRSSSSKRHFDRRPSGNRKPNSKRRTSSNSWYGLRNSSRRSSTSRSPKNSRSVSFSRRRSTSRKRGRSRGPKCIGQQRNFSFDKVKSENIIHLIRKGKNNKNIEKIPITSWRKGDKEAKWKSMEKTSGLKTADQSESDKNKLIDTKSSQSSNQLRIIFPPEPETRNSSTVEGYLAPVKDRLRHLITRSMASFMSGQDFEMDDLRDEENEERIHLHLDSISKYRGGGDGFGPDLDRDSRKNLDPNHDQSFYRDLHEHTKAKRNIQYDEFEPNEGELQLMRTKEFQEKLHKPRRLTTTIFTDDLRSGHLDTHLSVIVGNEYKEYKRVYQLLLQKDAPIEWSDKLLLDKYARTPSLYNATLKRLYDFRVMQSETPYERSLLEADFGDTQSLINRRQRQLQKRPYTSDSEESPSGSTLHAIPQYDAEDSCKRWQKHFSEQEKSPIELLLEQKRQQQAAESTRLKFRKLKYENRETQRQYQHQKGHTRFRSRSSQSRRSSGSRKNSLDRQYTNPRSTSREQMATLLDSEMSVLYRARKKRSTCSVCGLSYCGTDSDSNDSRAVDNLHLTEKLINNYKYLRLK